MRRCEGQRQTKGKAKMMSPEGFGAVLGAVVALLTAIGALVSGLSATRRLRHGLTQDVEIAQHVRPAMKHALRHDMDYRVRRLIALSRYPHIRGVDIAAVLALVLANTVFFVLGQLEAHRAVDAPALVPIEAVVCLLGVLGLGAIAFVISVVLSCNRAMSRIKYLNLSTWVDPQEARHRYADARLSYFGLAAVVTVLGLMSYIFGWGEMFVSTPDLRTFDRIALAYGLILVVPLAAGLILPFILINDRRA
jgi:hypothetical protein